MLSRAEFSNAARRRLLKSAKIRNIYGGSSLNYVDAIQATRGRTGTPLPNSELNRLSRMSFVTDPQDLTFIKSNMDRIAANTRTDGLEDGVNLVKDYNNSTNVLPPTNKRAREAWRVGTSFDRKENQVNINLPPKQFFNTPKGLVSMHTHPMDAPGLPSVNDLRAHYGYTRMLGLPDDNTRSISMVIGQRKNKPGKYQSSVYNQIDDYIGQIPEDKNLDFIKEALPVGMQFEEISLKDRGYRGDDYTDYLLKHSLNRITQNNETANIEPLYHVQTPKRRKGFW